MQHRLLALLAVPVVASTALLGMRTAAAGAPEQACSNASLRGGYGLSGDGALAGAGFNMLTALAFDGSGKMAGTATAVLAAPAAVEHVMFENGTYSVNSNCTGTGRFFAAHKTLAVMDHFHLVEFVVSDQGKQLSMILVTTEYRDGAPSLPTESARLVGHRM